MLIKEMPLEVAEVLDHLPAEQALVPISHLSDRQPSSKEKNSVRIGFMLYQKIPATRRVFASFNIYLYIHS